MPNKYALKLARLILFIISALASLFGFLLAYDYKIIAAMCLLIAAFNFWLVSI